MRAIPFSALVALLIVGVVHSPAVAQSVPAIDRDTVVVGLATEPDTFNLLLTQSPAVFAVIPIHSTLFVWDVVRDSRGELSPVGVEYMPTVKEGTWKLDGDRMTLVWRLKPRRWHDGTPVTCADYVFSARVARDERVSPLGRLVHLASITCPNGATGRELIANFAGRWPWANQGPLPIPSPFPRHILEPVYRRGASAFISAPYWTSPDLMVGDGPYRLIEWEKGNSITLVSAGVHPVFGTPRIKRIIYRFVDNPDVLASEMLKGTIDVIASPLQFDPAIRLRTEARGRIVVHVVPGTFWEHIDFNLDNPLLRDVRVRRAIAHAVNRTVINQQTSRGFNPVAHTYAPPGHPAYTDEVPVHTYDPIRARVLLREAGFTPGPDGIMRNAAGERLSLELNSTTTRVREQIEGIIQQQLRAIGIEVTIANFPPRVLFADGGPLFRRRLKGMVLFSWSVPPDRTCRGLFASDRIPSEDNKWVGDNFSGYRNSEVDRLCITADTEFDPVKQKQLLVEASKLLARDLPALPLFFRAEIAATKAGLQGFRISRFAFNLNAHEWHWK